MFYEVRVKHYHFYERVFSVQRFTTVTTVLLRLSTTCTHIAAVVDEPRQVAALGGVDDGVEVDAEQVGAADAGGLVVRLAHVGHDRPDHLPHVLYHHLVCCYRLLWVVT